MTEPATAIGLISIGGVLASVVTFLLKSYADKKKADAEFRTAAASASKDEATAGLTRAEAFKIESEAQGARKREDRSYDKELIDRMQIWLSEARAEKDAVTAKFALILQRVEACEDGKREWERLHSKCEAANEALEVAVADVTRRLEYAEDKIERYHNALTAARTDSARVEERLLAMEHTTDDFDRTTDDVEDRTDRIAAIKKPPPKPPSGRSRR